MARPTDARSEMLERISGIVGTAAPEDAVAEWEALPRSYRVATGLDFPAKIELLVDRLRDYDAVVYRASPGEIAARIREILEGLGLREVLVPPGLEQGWIPQDVVAGMPTLAAESAAKVGHDLSGHHTDEGAIRFVEDEGFSPGELDRFTAVLTASTLAIAETGTIVLQNLPGQGRRAATLVPDVHVCVVFERDVVHTVPEAMRGLQATAELPTTFISGPSATADIEMTRIKGVHGPRFLHVVLVG